MSLFIAILSVYFSHNKLIISSQLLGNAISSVWIVLCISVCFFLWIECWVAFTCLAFVPSFVCWNRPDSDHVFVLGYQIVRRVVCHQERVRSIFGWKSVIMLFVKFISHFEYISHVHCALISTERFRNNGMRALHLYLPWPYKTKIVNLQTWMIQIYTLGYYSGFKRKKEWNQF